MTIIKDLLLTRVQLLECWTCVPYERLRCLWLRFWSEYIVILALSQAFINPVHVISSRLFSKIMILAFLSLWIVHNRGYINWLENFVCCVIDILKIKIHLTVPLYSFSFHWCIIEYEAGLSGTPEKEQHTLIHSFVISCTQLNCPSRLVCIFQAPTICITLSKRATVINWADLNLSWRHSYYLLFNLFVCTVSCERTTRFFFFIISLHLDDSVGAFAGRTEKEGLCSLALSLLSTERVTWCVFTSASVCVPWYK